MSERFAVVEVFCEGVPREYRSFDTLASALDLRDTLALEYPRKPGSGPIFVVYDRDDLARGYLDHEDADSLDTDSLDGAPGGALSEAALRPVRELAPLRAEAEPTRSPRAGAQAAHTHVLGHRPAASPTSAAGKGESCPPASVAPAGPVRAGDYFVKRHETNAMCFVLEVAQRHHTFSAEVFFEISGWLTATLDYGWDEDGRWGEASRRGVALGLALLSDRRQATLALRTPPSTDKELDASELAAVGW